MRFDTGKYKILYLPEENLIITRHALLSSCTAWLRFVLLTRKIELNLYVKYRWQYLPNDGIMRTRSFLASGPAVIVNYWIKSMDDLLNRSGY